MLAPIKCLCYHFSLKKSHLLVTGGVSRDSAQRESRLETLYSSASINAYATLPFPSAFPAMFFPRGKAGKDMGTMTFLFLSTSSLLFSLKCQLLLYSKRGGDAKQHDHFVRWKPRLGSGTDAGGLLVQVEIIVILHARQIQGLSVLCDCVEQQQNHEARGG